MVSKFFALSESFSSMSLSLENLNVETLYFPVKNKISVFPVLSLNPQIDLRLFQNLEKFAGDSK